MRSRRSAKSSLKPPGDEEISLDLKGITGKSISEKQLQELDNQFVIVQGHLVLRRDPGLRVIVKVTKIRLAPVKKDK